MTAVMSKLYWRRTGGWAAANRFKAGVVVSVCLVCSVGGCGGGTMSRADQWALRGDAVRCLKRLSFDDSAAVRCQAIEALLEVAADEAVDEFRHHLSDEYWGVRFEACVGLGQAGHRQSRELLKKALEDPHDAVRAAAIYALHRSGDQSETSRLASMLLHHEQTAVRRLTAQLLGRLDEPKAVKLLRRAMKDRDEGVRWEVTAAMARLGENSAVQQLVFFANSGFSDQQTFALLELALLAEPKCTELFRYRLKEGPHLETRLVAARALGRLGYDEGLSVARKALHFDSPDLSADLVKRDPPVQQMVRKRSMAALALGAIGDPSSLPALGEVMGSGNHAVRAAAAKAIVEIVDRDRRGRSEFGEDVRRASR